MYRISQEGDEQVIYLNVERCGEEDDVCIGIEIDVPGMNEPVTLTVESGRIVLLANDADGMEYRIDLGDAEEAMKEGSLIPLLEKET